MLSSSHSQSLALVVALRVRLALVCSPVPSQASMHRYSGTTLFYSVRLIRVWISSKYTVWRQRGPRVRQCPRGGLSWPSPRQITATPQKQH